MCHHTLCVVTANHADVVRTRLAHEGLQDCIDTYFGSNQPGTKADHIREALSQYAATPERAWMVGDSVSDFEAARFVLISICKRSFFVPKEFALKKIFIECA